MATKKKTTRKKKTSAGTADELKESMHRVWLAGLGALATAETEGSRVFNQLVERGEDFSERSRPAIRGLKSKATSARKRAEGTWDEVEKRVDRTVSNTLKKLGIPSRTEISALSKRVEQLTRKLESLEPRARRTAARKTTKRKAAAKRTTRRKAPASARR